MIITKENNNSRLILGTAQFGLPYGISNSRGQIQAGEVAAILVAAAKAGITTLDTAAAYGNSENILASTFGSVNETFQIISKCPPNKPELTIKHAFNESAQRLQVPKLYGYLLHSYASYTSNKKIIQELQELKADGLVEKIGISLYHPEEAEELIKDGAAIDIVQFPYSVFDRRFEKVLPHLRQQGIETHVRSVYLQGLYFMSAENFNGSLKAAGPKIEQLQQLARSSSVPLPALLLGFALANPHISKVVIGVESLQTLKENITYSDIKIPPKLLEALQQFKEEDQNIILPYLWPKT
ncbi:aldo/keto reductase [Pontibacter akesuensis]|uniref:Predicted oxidoreductase n=1 Tax=Pontibacter akesuensis TaxID=388950 RepID=A0A1I7FN22_9BACT|nr:aldo/keto reductase [Pontibacter akesuensis]GHA61400.1 aldo/keto reductase [Pontibacter akesuensis]SFU37583.1 Predicted oxidoreductase [Pontibacter akesuensis]